MEISKSDWKLFRAKLPEWQERHMARLCNEYLELLGSDAEASTRFWELEERIRNDKKNPGVMLRLSKADVLWDIIRLIACDAISLSDLKEFSEELQNFVINEIQQMSDRKG